MNGYTWGVDSYGRKHICKQNDWVVLMCVLPNESVWSCIDQMESQSEQGKTA